MRLQQRALTTATLREAMATLEIIESYPQDRYLPSFLLRGESVGTVFHVQIATDIEGENISGCYHVYSRPGRMGRRIAFKEG
jgi:hypothetical protein